MAAMPHTLESTMIRLPAAFLFVASVLLPCLPATAEEAWPDLTGTWTGTTEAVVRGDPLHHEGGQEPYLSETVFTLTIEGQDGRRFWGQIASEEGDEPLVGVIANDRSTLYAADLDGYSFMTLVDENTIDLCYVLSALHVQVAACNSFTREP